jgi:hypothetical protein
MVLHIYERGVILATVMKERTEEVFEKAKEIAETLEKYPHDEAHKIIALVACSLGLRVVGY